MILSRINLCLQFIAVLCCAALPYTVHAQSVSDSSSASLMRTDTPKAKVLGMKNEIAVCVSLASGFLASYRRDVFENTLSVRLQSMYRSSNESGIDREFIVVMPSFQVEILPRYNPHVRTYAEVAMRWLSKTDVDDLQLIPKPVNTRTLSLFVSLGVGYAVTDNINIGVEANVGPLPKFNDYGNSAGFTFIPSSSGGSSPIFFTNYSAYFGVLF
ncbi:MAG: hypothetical protein JNL32_02665 [Candidatus Kapabacteria bacterium]|nr:hypothetical protein [Candidatus Kapabacteria bacterium]